MRLTIASHRSYPLVGSPRFNLMEAEHSPPSRVAVIAVHGVADQRPCETARATADLLAHVSAVASRVTTAKTTGQDPDECVQTGCYQAFEESELRILVESLLPAGRESPASVKQSPDKSPPEFSWRQQSRTAASRIHGEKSDQRAKNDVAYDYMCEQLSQHVVSGSDGVFETLRLDSVRTGSKADVAIFELYWADLSRFVGNWLRWVIEFYQLLFFLCLVGRKSLDFARASYEQPARSARMKFWRGWPIFGWCQIVSEQVLVLFVPVLNLYLLGLSSCILPLLIPVNWIPKAFIGFLGLVGALGTGFVIYRKRRTLIPGGRSWPRWLPALFAVFAAIGCAGLFWPVPESARYLWLELAWWLVPFAVITLSMVTFQKSRPGAFPAGLYAGILVSIVFGVQLFLRHANPPQVMDAILRASEYTVRALAISWLIILLTALGASISAFFAARAVPEAADKEPCVEKDKASRAAWTANLTLVLPALVVLILNLTLWQTIIGLAVPSEAVVAASATSEKSKSPLAFINQSELWNAPHSPINDPAIRQSITEGDPVWKASQRLMEQSYTPFYWLICALFAGAALLLVWSITPAVIAELRLDEQKNQTPTQRTNDSSWLGENLSAGFRAMRLSGEIVRATFIVVLPLDIILTALRPDLIKVEWMQTANHVFLIVGAWLVAALVVAKGPFKGIALGLRSALDVALDVINWLRLHPLESNPRARICARFRSLIRHVEEWKDPRDGTGFKAIVIFAHSQGTVIAADLLRFLQHPDNAALAPKLPIYLFTMGNPLRQLYSLRFPHLYSWARHDGSTWAGDEPLPAAIGVKRWVNAYRSGDYVGRYLWHPDGFSGAVNPIWSTEEVHIDGRSRKREFCIGSGAHTHYWDETAPEIAVELDRLIGLAAR
ncbi:MAG: hypothetical protein ABI946_05520 [Chthoniobacterales bacterium]